MDTHLVHLRLLQCDGNLVRCCLALHKLALQVRDALRHAFLLLEYAAHVAVSLVESLLQDHQRVLRIAQLLVKRGGARLDLLHVRLHLFASSRHLRTLMSATLQCAGQHAPVLVEFLIRHVLRTAEML
jgi:hypothetical protein